MTVMIVNFADAAFAIDSVLVAVGLSDNLILIFTGVALGIIAIRVAAGGFIKVLDRYPALEDVAYLLVGWISVKLFIESYGMFVGDPHIEMHSWLFWTGMGTIAVGGTLNAIRLSKRKNSSEESASDATKEIA